MPHQVQASRQVFRALTHGEREWGYPGAVDLSDVGTGKSFIDLAAMACVRPKVIVLTPVAGIPGWEATFKILGIEPHFIGSHQAVRGGGRPSIGSIKPGDRFFSWQNAEEIGIILDEGHFANGIDTQMMACMGGAIIQKVPMIVASASLATSPLHLRIAGRITGLHKGGHDWWRWLLARNCAEDPNEPGRWVWRAYGDQKRQVMTDIHKILIPQRGCRVRKSDMGERPGTTIQVLPIEVPEGPDIERKLVDLDKRLEWMKRQGLPYEQISNYRRGQRSKIWQASEKALIRPVSELIRADLDEGRSVVAFFSFTDSRIEMGKILKRREGLFGGQSPKQRKHWIAEFQANRLHVLLNNISSGGASVSLHDLTGERERVSYIFPTDRFTLMEQAPGRIDRFGGQTPSMQWIPCIAGGMSQRMVEATQKKLLGLAHLNDGVFGGQRHKTKDDIL